MHLLGLSSLVLSSALVSAPSVSPTPSAPTTPRSASTEIEFEVVDRSGGKTSSFGFIAPVDGSVEAFIERGGDPQRCEVKVHPVRPYLHLELRCDGSPAHSLRVKATRSLVAGTRTRLAEVSRPGGATSQVFVTLR